MIMVSVMKQGYGNQSKGFSLLEVMVALAIVGILTMVALPSYTNYVERSRRGDGMDLLLSVATAQQQYYLTNRAYAADIDDLPISALSEDAHYLARVVAASQTGYVLRAGTSGTGVSGQQNGDGEFELRSTGRKSWDCNNSGTFSCSWSDASRK